MVELPLSPVGRIIKNEGRLRISEDANESLTKVLEVKGEEIAAEAVKLPRHAKKTVKSSDSELVIKNL